MASIQKAAEEFGEACICWCSANGTICEEVALALKVKTGDEISPGDGKGDKWGVIRLCLHLNSGVVKHLPPALAGPLW